MPREKKRKTSQFDLTVYVNPYAYVLNLINDNENTTQISILVIDCIVQRQQRNTTLLLGPNNL